MNISKIKIFNSEWELDGAGFAYKHPCGLEIWPSRIPTKNERGEFTTKLAWGIGYYGNSKFNFLALEETQEQAVLKVLEIASNKLKFYQQLSDDILKIVND